MCVHCLIVLRFASQCASRAGGVCVSVSLSLSLPCLHVVIIYCSYHQCSLGRLQNESVRHFLILILLESGLEEAGLVRLWTLLENGK